MRLRRVLLAVGCLVSLVESTLGAPGRRARPRAITQCSWSGNTFELRDWPAVSLIGEADTLRIVGHWVAKDQDRGAIFTFLLGAHDVLSRSISDLTNPNGWIGFSDDRRSIALNTSNGGAAGGWSVSLFHVDDSGTPHDISSAMKLVEDDFSKRHNCKMRGDNYEAMQWRSKTELLISASVYGTSDCGAEMGYTEGYLLDIASRRITARLSEHQMLELPYVCTYNVWERGDPDPP